MPLIRNQFPSKADLTRIKEEENYHLLYACEVYDTDENKGVFRLKEFFSGDEDKKKILSIALNLPNLIINAGVDFLFGEEPTIKVSHSDESVAKKIQEEVDAIIRETDFHVTLEQSAISLQTIGHTQFNMRLEDEEPIIEEIPFDMWFPSFNAVPVGQKPKTIRLASYITVEKDGESNSKFIYVQEHNAGTITHTLWINQEKRIADQVTFGRVPGLAAQLGFPDREGETEIVEDTELEQLAVFQIDTRKTVKDRFGKSLLKPILPLIEEVNDRLTQISLQFLKTLDPTLQVPESAVKVDEKGRVKRRSLDVLLMAPDMPDAKYITNDNPLIEEAFNHIKMMIEKCADLTMTPRSFLMPDDKGGVESAEALRTRFMGFLKRIKRYQKVYAPAIPRMLKTAMKLKGVEDIPEDIKITVEFDEGLPRDKIVDVEFYGSAVGANLMSRRTAVGALQELEGDALEEEMKEIEEDEKNAPGLNLGQPPIGDGNNE